MNEAIIDMHQNARISMEFMTRELKNAYFLDKKDDKTICFYTDSDNNTVIGTSTGGNALNTLKDTSQSWVADDWKGVLVAITAGKGEGQVCEVLENTDKQLTLCLACPECSWDVTADETSVYRLDVKKKEFALVDDTLKYQKGTGDLYPFANNISDLCFTVDSTNDAIEIRLVTRSSRKDPKDNEYHTYNLKSTIITRN
ncbi:MAG: hypothetical protein ACMUIP_13745 [bacterium]